MNFPTQLQVLASMEAYDDASAKALNRAMRQAAIDELLNLQEMEESEPDFEVVITIL